MKKKLFWFSLHNYRKPYPLLSKRRVIQVLGKERENYGDLASKYIVEKKLKRKTSWYRPQSDIEKNLFAIGSILNYSDEKTIVWGSGIIDRKHPIQAREFYAVRGPYTRERVLKLGFDCPEIFGDPAMLLPKYYSPRIEKKFEVGIAPHYADLELVKTFYKGDPRVRVVDLLTESVEKTTDEILSCKRIISSSLHGIIVAHSYNIPAVWVKFSNNLYGDDIKFHDYFSSVGLSSYEGVMINRKYSKLELIDLTNSVNNLPSSRIANDLTEGLLRNFPSI